MWLYVCYDDLEYFSIIWYNLWPFGIVCGPFAHFSHFGMFGPRKIWQPRCRLALQRTGVMGREIAWAKGGIF
jgi:hypothetical protein